jgi:hypothetical protein
MHFFHIMENHIIWRVKFSLVLKLPPNLHYQSRQTSPLLLSSATQSLDRLCAFMRCIPVRTRHSFWLVINMSLSLLWPIAVKVKGNQAILHKEIEHYKAKTPKIVENKKYFIKHVKLYNWVIYIFTYLFGSTVELSGLLCTVVVVFEGYELFSFLLRIAYTDDRLAMWLKLQQYVKVNNYVQYE